MVTKRSIHKWNRHYWGCAGGILAGNGLFSKNAETTWENVKIGKIFGKKLKNSKILIFGQKLSIFSKKYRAFWTFCQFSHVDNLGQTNGHHPKIAQSMFYIDLQRHRPVRPGNGNADHLKMRYLGLKSTFFWKKPVLRILNNYEIRI